MADIQTQLPIKITDGSNTAAISGASALKVDGSAVTQPVSGTVTLSSQTVTLSSNTVTLSSQTVTTTADQTVAPGTVGSKSLLVGMVYNTAAPTPTNGQGLALQSDSAGNLKVAGNLTTTPSGTQAVSYGSGTFPVSGTVTLSSQTVTLSSQTVTAVQSGTWTVATNADTNLAAGTAPSKALVTAIQYNSTQPTLTTGQTVAQQSDVNGNTKVAVQGTAAVTGTVTLSSQTVTLSSNTVTLSSQTVTTNAESSIGAGAAPTRALVGAVVYNTAAPTLTNGQTAALQGDVNANLKVVLQGTSTVTSVPSGTQTVTGTVTLSSQTVTLSSQTVTLSSQTVTVGNSPTVTIGATSVTQPVSGSVTVVPETSQIVTSAGTATTIASASTGTISYTVTTAKTLYWKGFTAAASGGPCKVTVDYGAGPTQVLVGFFSSASPFLNVTFPQPILVAATTVVNIKIQNNAGSAQDVYATIFGAEH